MMDLISGIENADIKETIKERLIKEGLSGLNEDIRFSLGYSQGDGISFFGKVSLKEFVEAQKLEVKTEILDFIGVRIYSNSNHYCHYNTMEIESDIDDQEIYDEVDKEFAENRDLISHILVRCKQISKELETECYHIIENLESEEYMKEFCDINNDLFFKHGDYIFEDIIEHGTSTEIGEAQSV